MFALDVIGAVGHQTRMAHTRYSVAYIITSGIPGEERQVDVTLENEQGGTSKFQVATPWKYEKDDFLPESFLYVNAQNQEHQGTIKTEIYVDGDLVKSSTSVGEYSVASASDRLP